MLMSPPLKYIRRKSVVSVENLDTFIEIALNLSHGLRKKVSLVLLHVSNQIKLKFLIILGGFTQIVLFMFLIQCRDSLQQKP